MTNQNCIENGELVTNTPQIIQANGWFTIRYNKGWDLETRYVLKFFLFDEEWVVFRVPREDRVGGCAWGAAHLKSGLVIARADARNPRGAATRAIEMMQKAGKERVLSTLQNLMKRVGLPSYECSSQPPEASRG